MDFMLLQNQRIRYTVLAADLYWAASAMGFSYLLRYMHSWHDPLKIHVSALVPFLATTIVVWSTLSLCLHLDGFHGGWRFPAILSQLVLSVSGLMMSLLAGAYLARLYTSRLILVYFGCLFFCGLIAIRIILRAFLASRYRSGAVRKVVIVGSGPIAIEIARKIESHPETLLQVAGFLCSEETAPSLAGPGISPVSTRSVGIVDLLQSRAIDELILAVPGHRELSDLVVRCINHGVAVSLVPQPYELYLSAPKMLDLDGLPLLKFESIPKMRPSPAWKSVLDLVLATCLLPMAGPVILIAASWLRISKGRAFCSEPRCGQFGKTFLMYRLNSDRRTEKLTFPEALIQQLSLSELPQIWNVLKGEMSFVGPRPEGPERVRHYTDWHRQRLSVKPGITGLAQVHGLREHNSSEDKTRYDLQYILECSPFLDISLLLQTQWTLTLRLFKRRSPTGELQQQAGVPIKIPLDRDLSSAHSSQPSQD